MGSAPGGVLALIFELLWTVLFFIGLFIGRYIVAIVTLGHYPTRYPTPAQKLTMFLIGTLVLVATLVTIRNLIWP